MIIYIIRLTLKKKPIIKNSNLLEIRNKLKTGDIIFFSRKETDIIDWEYYFRKKLLGSTISHIGLIYRENDNIYVVECTSKIHTGNNCCIKLNKHNNGGIRIIQFDKLISIYSGYFYVKFISKEIPNDLFLNKLDNYKKYVYPNKFILLVIFIIDRLISTKFAEWLSKHLIPLDTIICCEFVYRLLLDCNVVKKYPFKTFWPFCFNDEIFNSLQKVTYSKAYKFVHNI